MEDSALAVRVSDRDQVHSHGDTATSSSASITLYTDCIPGVISDANGNITHVTDDDGAVVAAYEYNPFGETISCSGPEAENNRFRFSSKYWDAETGLGYYGFRHLDAAMGRWPSRDPVGEWGGLNPYAFVGNEAIGHVDWVGLLSFTIGGMEFDFDGCDGGRLTLPIPDLQSREIVLPGIGLLVRVGASGSVSVSAQKDGMPKEECLRLANATDGHEPERQTSGWTCLYGGSQGPIRCSKTIILSSPYAAGSDVYEHRLSWTLAYRYTRDMSVTFRKYRWSDTCCGCYRLAVRAQGSYWAEARLGKAAGSGLALRAYVLGLGTAVDSVLETVLSFRWALGY